MIRFNNELDFTSICQHLEESGGDDSATDPSWWYYKKEQIEVVRHLVKEWKPGEV